MVSMVLPMIRGNSSSRSCGDCTACCTLLGIQEIKKPAGLRCRYLKLLSKDGVGGCTIYKDRPSACADFQCLWLRGFGLRRHRPDRSGIMFTAGHSACPIPELQPQQSPQAPLMLAWECGADSRKSPLGGQVIRIMMDEMGFAVIVKKHEGGFSILSHSESALKKAHRVGLTVSEISGIPK